MKFNKKIKVTDIAQAAGVSQAAVSRYINGSGYVSDDKKQSIAAAMDSLGVQVSDEPPASRGRNRKIFGLLIPPLNGNVQYTCMASFFSEAAKTRGYSTRVYAVNLSETELNSVLQTMLKDHLSGIFIPVVPMLELDKKTQKTITESEIPIVMFSEFLNPYPKINSIVNNFDAGINMAVNHLWECGCRNIALMTPPTTQSKSAVLQQRAFRNIVQTCGTWDSWQITEYAWDEPTFTKAGYNCARLAFEKNPQIDGIICWTDSYAAGILWYLYETGRNIPKDVKIVASNDDYAAYLCPPITTYALSNESVCTEALDMLIRLQSTRERDNVKHVYLTPKFIIRRSTELK